MASTLGAKWTKATRAQESMEYIFVVGNREGQVSEAQVTGNKQDVCILWREKRHLTMWETQNLQVEGWGKNEERIRALGWGDQSVYKRLR